MAKIISLFVVLALLLAYVAAPIRTVMKFAEGVREGDGYKIAETIDIPAITESVVVQVNAMSGNKLGKLFPGDSVLGVVGGIVAGVVIESVAERVVAELLTTTGLANIMRGFGRAWEPVDNTFGILPYIGLLKLVSIDGPMSFRISSPGTASSRVVLVFTMEQWEWKLRDIRLPRMSF